MRVFTVLNVVLMAILTIYAWGYSDSAILQWVAPIALAASIGTAVLEYRTSRGRP